jgi:hypothetical protein
MIKTNNYRHCCEDGTFINYIVNMWTVAYAMSLLEVSHLDFVRQKLNFWRTSPFLSSSRCPCTLPYRQVRLATTRKLSNVMFPLKCVCKFNVHKLHLFLSQDITLNRVNANLLKVFVSVEGVVFFKRIWSCNLLVCEVCVNINISLSWKIR